MTAPDQTAPPPAADGLWATLTGDLARKGALALGDQAVQSGANFLAGLLLARLCNKDEFGAYAIVFGILLVFQGLQNALITLPMMVLGAARKEEDFRRYFTSLLAAQVALGLGAAALLLGGWAVAARLAPGSPLVRALPATALALPFVLAQEFMRRALFARTRVGGVLANDLLSTSLRVAGLLALWRLGSGSWSLSGPAAGPGHLDAGTAMLAWAGAGALGTAWGLWQLRGHLQRSLAGAAGVYRENWRFGRWTLAEQAGSVLALQATPWIVGAICGLGAAGLLEGPRLLLAPLQVFWFAGANLLLPQASRTFTDEGPRALSRLLWRAAPVWAAVFIGWGALIAAAPQFWISKVLGPHFAGAEGILLLWVAVYMVLGAAQLPAMGLLAIRRPDVTMFIRLGAGTLGLGLTAVLAAWKGPAWAVGAMLISSTFALAAIGAVFARLLGRAPTEIPEPIPVDPQRSA